MKNQIPRVSIVILIYNLPYEKLIPIIKSVNSTSYQNIEIIIVDNSEKPKLSNDLNGKQLIYISGQGNAGVPGGRNIGVKNSTGEYIFFIDDDILLEKDTVKELVEILEKNPSLGIIGPSPYTLSTLKLNEYYQNYLTLYPNKNLVDVPYVLGCSMFVKREVFQKIGLFDALLFFYHEEADLCLRARKAGYRCVFARDIRSWHLGQPDSPEKFYTPRRAYFFYRNFFVFAGRNSKTWKDSIGYLLKNLIFCGKDSYPIYFIIGALRFKKTEAVKSYFMALKDGLVLYTKLRLLINKKIY